MIRWWKMKEKALSQMSGISLWKSIRSCCKTGYVTSFSATVYWILWSLQLLAVGCCCCCCLTVSLFYAVISRHERQLLPLLLRYEKIKHRRIVCWQTRSCKEKVVQNEQWITDAWRDVWFSQIATKHIRPVRPGYW